MNTDWNLSPLQNLSGPCIYNPMLKMLEKLSVPCTALVNTRLLLLSLPTDRVENEVLLPVSSRDKCLHNLVGDELGCKPLINLLLFLWKMFRWARFLNSTLRPTYGGNHLRNPLVRKASSHKLLLYKTETREGFRNPYNHNHYLLPIAS